MINMIYPDAVVGITKDRLSDAQFALVYRSDNSDTRVYVRGPTVRTGRSLEKYGCKVLAIRGQDGHEFLNARQWAPVFPRIDQITLCLGRCYPCDPHPLMLDF